MTSPDLVAVTLTHPWMGHTDGATVEVTSGQANLLVERMKIGTYAKKPRAAKKRVKRATKKKRSG